MKQYASLQHPSHLFIGAVKWFDNSKGFGILALPSEEELFLHIKGFKAKPTGEIRPHDVIIGEKIPDQRKGGYVATRCSLLENPADWEAILQLLGKPNLVKLPTKISSKTKQEHTYNIVELAAIQLFRTRNDQELFSLAVSYLDYSSSDTYFLDYIRLIKNALDRHLGKSASTSLLSRIFHHFGTHVTPEILFRVWKAQQFHYIGYPEEGDYEIPEEILNLYATEIGPHELQRIQSYSFGPNFCADLSSAIIGDIDSISQQEIERYLPYLDFLSEEEKQQLRSRRLEF